MNRNQFGMDHGTRFPPSEAVLWAAENDVQYVDVCLDNESLDDVEYEDVRSACDEHGISLGLHIPSRP
ncbi:hypothetical protein SAMN04487967_2794 [Natronorubrum sediminis]|uniref:Sugar phosphate isomerase/epimerase n=1 Tax=Natronorubrum sediminis TaxID=640943 RepID=A0A1H6G3D2_9EURY|nr:hypothetical protein SAMN04487967_2794 [Natronorubrum sediminis]